MNTTTTTAENILTAARRLEILKTRNLDYLGLGPSQAHAIVIIATSPGISQSRLAEKMGIDSSTTSKLVTKLLRAQLAKKVRSTTDHRVFGLIPTDLANVSLRSYRIEIEALETVVNYGFSPGDTEQFNKLLRRTSATIQHVLDLPDGELFPPLFDIPFPK